MNRTIIMSIVGLIVLIVSTILIIGSLEKPKTYAYQTDEVIETVDPIEDNSQPNQDQGVALFEEIY